MTKNTKLLKHILLIFKGVLVGFGAIMPGISGGTLCVAFGMYKPLLNVLSNPKKAIKDDGFKLLMFIIGAGLGFVGLSGLAGWLMEINSTVVTCVFIGFIIGTLPELWKDASKHKRDKFSILSMIIGFFALTAILLFLRKSTSINISPDFAGYILCGILWGLSFIVPGLSSSTLIMFFGLYQPMLDGISGFNFSVLIPLGIGVLLCVLILSRAVNFAFKMAHSKVSHAIIGIVVASMLMVVPAEMFNTAITFVSALLCIISGAAVSYLAGYFSSKLTHD